MMLWTAPHRHVSAVESEYKALGRDRSIFFGFAACNYSLDE
jgi:hypothetical protein